MICLIQPMVILISLAQYAGVDVEDGLEVEMAPKMLRTEFASFYLRRGPPEGRQLQRVPVG